jgi:uncharacterized protein (TIGR03083 family)
VTIERDDLLGIAQAERAALGRTIQYTAPEAWGKPSRLDGWTLKDVVAHLAASERVASAALGSEPAAEVEEFLRDGGDLTIDAFNDYAVRRRAETPLRDLVVEWGRHADTALARAGAIPADDWGSAHVSWLAGEVPARSLLQSRVMEWWVHGEDIRAGADLPPRAEHWPVYCTNDLAVRTLPWALGLAGLRFEGRALHFVLEGSGGGEWRQGLAPRQSVDPDSPVDALVEGRGIAFAQVASRRVPAEEYFDDGTLVLSGDADLALTVLRHIRAFA